MQETPRIAELRRRLQNDPASIAFGQLAEEYRRAGDFAAAVEYCRTGLARHPGYLSARVTLGRALVELGELDDAAREFALVLRSAPENLAAIRGMADIHQRRGVLEQALGYYTRALELARFDPDLDESVNRIRRQLVAASEDSAPAGLAVEEPGSQATAAPAAMAAADAAPPPLAADAPEPEQPVDLDAWLASLGRPDAMPPPMTERLLTTGTWPREPDAIAPANQTHSAAANPFADMELALSDQRRRDGDSRAEGPAPDPAQTPDPPQDDPFVKELEGWLRVLTGERSEPPRS